MYERHVIMSGITATSGSILAGTYIFLKSLFSRIRSKLVANSILGINTNYGDTATFSKIVTSDVDNVCVKYKGTDDNDEEPVKVGSGADGTYCIYSSSDVKSS